AVDASRRQSSGNRGLTGGGNASRRRPRSSARLIPVGSRSTGSLRMALRAGTQSVSPRAASTSSSPRTSATSRPATCPMVPRGRRSGRRFQVETLPTCSELAMTEFGRLVAERMGWTAPRLDSASSILGFMRESAAFQRKVEDWAKANHEEALGLMRLAEEEATRKHEERITERLQEHADARAADAPRKLAAFLSSVGVGDVTRDAVVGSLEDTIALRAVKEWT